jgi:Flp pilus assembly pilin Flp
MNFLIAQYLELRLNRDQKGMTTVEYAIMLILVASAVLAGGGVLPTKIITIMSSLATAL